MKMFGSDNFSGVHPCVFEELMRVNADHVVAYGDDMYTREACELLQRDDLLGTNCDIMFTWNGTGTNVVALSALVHSYESVICPQSAHINNDECGAPEHIAGLKLVPVATPDGKLTPELIEPCLSVVGFEHAAQPRVISISNSTEEGTIYSPEELKALCDYAHAHNLLVHCDGARIANAVVGNDCTLFDLTAGAGLDALSLGGTKNALMGAEAVVLFGEARNRALFMIRKSSGQMPSKMRFVAAQFSALYRDGVWLECARNANAQATYLMEGLKARGIALTKEVRSNEVFALLPREIIEPLQEQYHFYTWNEDTCEVRFVTSWDTRSEEVDDLLASLDSQLAQLKGM